MLEDESEALGTEHNIYEVDVERQYRIAEAYGILAVPTLVAGAYKISGVPEASDLRSFLLQAVSHSCFRLYQVVFSDMVGRVSNLFFVRFAE
jgi:hypothetical protein